MSDVKREQELADKSKNDGSSEQVDSNSSNNAFKKLFNKLRKRSVDSRNDPDISHAESNAGSGASGGLNSLVSAIRDQTSGSTGSSSVTSNALALFSSGKSDAYTSKSGSGGSSMPLANSMSGGVRLITISEKNESPTKKSLNMLSRNSSQAPFKYPVLPPLSEAQSVKQKWNILLSKAKGGVENIPKAFLTCTNELSESVPSSMNIDGGGLENTGQEIRSAEHNSAIRKKPSFKATHVSGEIPSLSISTSKLQSTSKSDNEKSDTKEEKNVFLHPNSCLLHKTESLRSRASSNQLDESQGFFLDLDNIDLERSTKSSRFDDGLNRNPSQLLRSLIDYRQELKIEIESLNTKISKIDKKISELLQLVLSPSTTIEINRGQMSANNQDLG